MAEQDRIERLDEVVARVLASRREAPASGDAELDTLAAIAVDLLGLPQAGFREKLRAELESGRRDSEIAPARLREGFHTITPYLKAPGAAALIAFLTRAFRAEELLRVPGEGGAIRHAELRIGDSVVEVSDGSAAFPPFASAMHLYVEDADAAYARALEAGAASLHAPVDQPYGDREAGVKDPAGNSWYLATHRATGLAPEGLRSVTPYVQARDTAGLIDFVRRAFGGEERDRTESPDGIVHHAKLRIGDSVLEMGEAHGPYGPAPAAIRLHVANADAVYARAIRAGAEPIFPVADQPYGERSGGVRDPFGNLWFIATYFEDVAS
jgi:PhnB protein